jgi:serine/threonine protein kinase
MSFDRVPGAEPIPGYRLIEPLGSGGFGEAWKCVAPGEIYKAIKFVYGNLNSLDMDGVRAEQELKALRRIKDVRYPFVLPMDRIEIVEGELVIVMELADRSLHDAFEEAVSSGLRGIPRDALLRYIRDAADALDHMASLTDPETHEPAPLQHLDIKPRNLFLVSDRVKVADFGLVKCVLTATASGILGGVTPLYAPPETFTGGVSIHSDQYSLAIVYMELLTGQRPFVGKNARQLAQAHLHQEPDLRSLPEAERPVVARALAKDPDKRWPNCLSFVRALLMARPAAPQPSLPGVDLRANHGEGQRPRTIADTMEDMFLGPIPENPDDVLVPVDLDEMVDLGAGMSAGGEHISNLGVTMALPATGSLRPTLVVGLGSFGRRALLELRCRLIDRFGDLEKVPVFRFLYIDTDQDAVRASIRGTAEVALHPNEVYHLPLQPVSHYRRRQLDQLNDWLPREKLFALPRSLKTQGSRALGRLAFTDNYLRVQARLRREIQNACNPDNMYHTVSQTGLALRDNIPRVYVVASAAGGASGYLADLGYSLRRMLQTMRQPDAPVIGFVFLGAPEDPATPRQELANIYATLTELHHFSDPAIPFSAQYGTDGPRLVDQGPAFDATYLLPLTHRTPESRRAVMTHLGSYLFHEITTPLGIRLDRTRATVTPGATLFRAMGTFGVWFPRGLMLRLAARTAVQQVLHGWQSEGPTRARAELEASHARIVADPALQPDALLARITELAVRELDGPPAEALTRLLTQLEEQSQQVVAIDDPGNWARQTVQRAREWLGSGLQATSQELINQRGDGEYSPIHLRKSKLTRALEAAAAALAEQWDNNFTASALLLMEHPGERLALAEEALTRLVKFCDDSSVAMQTRVEQLHNKTRRAQDQLDTAVQNCVTGAGGFTWFGGRTRRLVRVFMDHLAAFSRQCLAEDLTAAVWQFFVVLRGRIGDRLRDLTLCRQRLRHAQEMLDINNQALEDAETGSLQDMPTPTPIFSTEMFWEILRDVRTARVILPDGVSDMEQAANSFLYTLTAEQWAALDQSFQDEVLSLRGGLYKACVTVADLNRHLIAPLLNQAVTYLGTQLPTTDVAEVEQELDPELEGEPAQRILAYHDAALPLISPTVVPPAVQLGYRRPDASALPAETPSFLLIPASEAGKRFGDEAEQILPRVQLVMVPGQADLMFCREQPALTLEDLERLLGPCRRAYEESATVPNLSPHARFDINDWSPLDP